MRKSAQVVAVPFSFTFTMSLVSPGNGVAMYWVYVGMSYCHIMPLTGDCSSVLLFALAHGVKQLLWSRQFPASCVATVGSCISTASFRAPVSMKSSSDW